MSEYYVIRQGWNAANQSSRGGSRNPKTRFQSCELALVGIVVAESEADAIKQVSPSCYNNQLVWATDNLRSVAGLTAESRKYRDDMQQMNCPICQGDKSLLCDCQVGYAEMLEEEEDNQLYLIEHKDKK